MHAGGRKPYGRRQGVPRPPGQVPVHYDGYGCEFGKFSHKGLSTLVCGLLHSFIQRQTGIVHCVQFQIGFNWRGAITPGAPTYL